MNKDHLLIEIKCAVMYHFEVLESCKTPNDKELENKRFNEFLNKLINKYERLSYEKENQH